MQHFYMAEAQKSFFVCHKRQEGSASTASTALWALARAQAIVVGVDGISVRARVHLLTDDVHQMFKHLLDVDVFLGAGFEEQKTWERATTGDQRDLATRSFRTSAQSRLVYHAHPPAVGRPLWL